MRPQLLITAIATAVALLGLIPAANAQTLISQNVNCVRIGAFNYTGVPATATVGFNWKAYAPAWSQWGMIQMGNWLLSPLSSVQWNYTLFYNVTVQYIDAWLVGNYNCTLTQVWQSGNKTYTTYQTEIVGRVDKEYWNSTVVSFKVGINEVSHVESKTVPIREYNAQYCSDLPTVSSWPNCASYYQQPSTKASLQKPGEWPALEINGLATGANYTVGNVVVTLQKPYMYTDSAGPDPVKLYSDTGQSGLSVGFRYGVTAKGSAVPRDTSTVEIDTYSIQQPPNIEIYYATGTNVNQAISVAAKTYLWGTVERNLVLGYYTFTEQEQQKFYYLCIYIGPPDPSWCSWIKDGVTAVLHTTGFPQSVTGEPVFVYFPTLKAVTKVAFQNGPNFDISSGLSFIVPYGSVLTLGAAYHYLIPSANGIVASPYTTLAPEKRTWAIAWDNLTGIKRLWFQRGLVAKVQLAVDNYTQNMLGRLGVLPLSFGGPLDTPPTTIGDIYSSATFTIKWLGTGDYAVPLVWNQIYDFGVKALTYIGSVESPWGVFNVANQSASLIGGPGEAKTLVGLKYLGATNLFDPGRFAPYLDLTLPTKIVNTVVNPGEGMSYVTGVTYNPIAPYYTSPPRWPGSDPMPVVIGFVPASACDTWYCTTPGVRVWGPLPREYAGVVMPNASYLMYVAFVNPYIGDTFGVRVWINKVDFVFPNGTVVYGDQKHMKLLVDTGIRKWTPYQPVLLGPGWFRDASFLTSPCSSIYLGAVPYIFTPNYGFFVTVEAYTSSVSLKATYLIIAAKPVLEVITNTTASANITAPTLNYTVRLWGETPMGQMFREWHLFPAFGEGGMWRDPVCSASTGDVYPEAQAVYSGDFRGYLEAAGVEANITEAYSRPAFVVLDWDKGLVNISAPGPVYGYAFYVQRQGAWVKAAEVRGRWVVVNASRIYPWDPVKVVPLLSQDIFVQNGESVVVWRPAEALLFKTWADAAGYPPGAQSQVVIVKAG